VAGIALLVWDDLRVFLFKRFDGGGGGGMGVFTNGHSFLTWLGSEGGAKSYEREHEHEFSSILFDDKKKKFFSYIIKKFHEDIRERYILSHMTLQLFSYKFPCFFNSISTDFPVQRCYDNPSPTEMSPERSSYNKGSKTRTKETRIPDHATAVAATWLRQTWRRTASSNSNSRGRGRVRRFRFKAKKIPLFFA
jgi:hypothetical protein